MEYLLAFVIAFVLAFFSTPIAAKIAYKIGAIDVPKDETRMHKRPTPLLGGIALFLGFWGSVIYCWFDFTDFPYNSVKLFGMLGGSLIVLGYGIFDDVRGMKPWQKLIFQTTAAAFTVFISNTRIENITMFFSDDGKMMSLNPVLSYVVTIFWIVAITNAINLIDGLDGLAAGISAICSLSLFVVTLIRTDISMDVKLYTTIITIAIAGSCLGFLPFNFNPAKIFMGETGAAFLGFTLGVITIQGTLKSYAAISIVLPVLILAIPLFDATFAFFRRLTRHKSVSQRDRSHIHHRLIDMGLSQRWSVLTLYVASAAFGICAVALAGDRIKYGAYLLLFIFILIFVGIKYMKEFSQHAHSMAVKPEKNTEQIDSLAEDNPENNKDQTI
ncbi:MAG TPA: undecaprenyl-phosphate alpha-N-acetylglucosaminyl 1-phosphate transferase [Clostridiales bacterium]|nr:undecaprenyl-phosphate alpha-N-acetylglucosaminyl 1-phosphate transferase [Clostridiales bacterium]